jgi:hypothetical protein
LAALSYPVSSYAFEPFLYLAQNRKNVLLHSWNFPQEAITDYPLFRWILFLALPQLDDEGKLTKVFGCTTDISHFKWAESVQMNSRIQAEEAKRQQETFIDMTS